MALGVSCVALDMSGIPYGSVLGLALFNISVSDTGTVGLRAALAIFW